MSWLFSQALVAEYSAANCSDGEPSAPSSGESTQQAYCAPDKMTAFSRLSRFGMTFKPLTVNHGEGLLMWFLEGFPVKTSAQQGKVPDSVELEAGCGLRWLGLFARYVRATSLWKTAQDSLITDSISSCVIWPKWGSMQSGACWERVMSALPMFEKGSGYWHTMTANDCKPAGKVEIAMVQAHERGESVPNTYIRLRSQVAARSNMCGPVNPPWAEWLMGWPLGWTDLKPSATDRFPYVPQQPGACLEGQ